ncbi:MAG TPA: TraB/GumN family protein [Cyclobacteriaceae bacterium]|nr:TraB/GumN family protein [Cyclobacteriaceae bacterium]
MKKSFLLVFALISSFLTHAQNSILWEVSGNGLASPSYVMGTLKFIGEKEFYLPKEAVAKMGTCKLFAIEDQVDHKAQTQLNKAVHFPKGKSLKTELSKEDYNKVTAFFNSEFKISPKAFEKEYAHLIPLALSINMTRMALGESVKFYDIQLLELAKKDKIETYSLEPIERESQAIQAFPMADQEAALLHSIANFEKQKSEYRQLEIAYLRGDLDKVFEFSLHPTENNPVFIEEFYNKRNLEWLPKIEKMIASKPSFIAVGVAHLEGEKGILNLLKQKGYTLNPIQVSH